MNEQNIIVSVQNPLVKHCVKLRMNEDYRCDNQEVLLEGIKPIGEVSVHVKQLLYTSSCASLVEELPGEKWQISEAILQKISGLRSPEGVIAILRMPPYISLGGAKRVLALDGVSDPGNLGALMRTALALGWDTLCVLPECCDLYNEKVLRAARGAHFKLKLSRLTRTELRDWAERENVQMLAANLKGESPENISHAKRRLLVLGNESRGLSEEMSTLCQPVTIAMPGEMESLNVAVAGGILLYTLSKKGSL